MASGRTSLYYDLLDGFKQPGCSICRFTVRAVERFFDTLTYENTNDPAIRDGVRAARGFCNRHTVQYLGFRDELGTAIIYRDLLHTVIPAIEAAAPEGLGPVAGILSNLGGRGADQAIAALAPHEVCFACRRVQEAEGHYLSTLLQHLRQPEFAAAYEQSDGLCTIHLSMALARTSGAPRDVLVRTQRRVWNERLERVATAGPDRKELEHGLTAAVGGKGLRP